MTKQGNVYIYPKANERDQVLESRNTVYVVQVVS